MSQPALSRRSFVKFAGIGTLMVAGGASLASLTGCAASSATQAAEKAVEAGELLSGVTFDYNTMVTLQAACSQDVLDAALARCDYFESIFSHTLDSSDIGRINASHGEPIEVSAETADIIQKSLAYSEASEGLFDISIGAVSSLWDFAQATKPTDEDLQEALTHVNYRNISVDGTTVTLADPAMKLDLGGIAKGYIADDLAAYFTSQGCESALINLGGNVYALGNQPDGTPWTVGIENPGVEDAVIGTVETKNKSTVASGMYEQQFELDGVTYHHILDPSTGYPAETDLESVSVVSDKSIDGDCWATILFLMGSDKALAVLNDRDDLSGLIIKRTGETCASQDSAIVPIEA